MNDDGTNRSQFLPAMAVDQSNGNVAIVWRDARNSSGNNTAELLGTRQHRPRRERAAEREDQRGHVEPGGRRAARAWTTTSGDYQGVAFANGKFIAGVDGQLELDGE